MRHLTDLFLGKKRPRVEDFAALQVFVDENAAFLVQKSIYEYSRARSGLAFEKLFKEGEFVEAIEASRWRAYPIGLRLLGEMTEAQIRPYAVGREAELLSRVRAACLAAFDRYPRPVPLTEEEWARSRAALSERLDRLQLAAAKAVMDIPLQDARAVFELMPIHPSLTSNDFELVRNNLRSNLCRIYETFLKVADLRALAAVGGPSAAGS